MTEQTPLELAISLINAIRAVVVVDRSGVVPAEISIIRDMINEYDVTYKKKFGQKEVLVPEDTPEQVRERLAEIETKLARGDRLYVDWEDAIPWLIGIAHKYLKVLEGTE